MIALPATLTEREACATLALLTQAVQQESDAAVVIDASALERLDSSALAVLLECQRVAKAAGRALEVRRPPAKLTSLAHLYGVDGVLHLNGPQETAPASA